MIDEHFNARWTMEGVPACAVGMQLLKRFAETYPMIQPFIRPEDFLNLHNEAFAGMPEWENFASHRERSLIQARACAGFEFGSRLVLHLRLQHWIAQALGLAPAQP